MGRLCQRLIDMLPKVLSPVGLVQSADFVGTIDLLSLSLAQLMPPNSKGIFEILRVLSAAVRGKKA